MPTITIPNKICPHCNGTKWSVRERIGKRGITYHYTCSVKAVEKAKKWKDANLDRYRENIKKIALRKKLYKEQNPQPRKPKTFKNHLPEEQLKQILLEAKCDKVSTKTCKSCNESKLISKFDVKVRKTGKVYVYPTCKRCLSLCAKDKDRYNEYCRNYYKNETKEKREKRNILASNWRKKNPDKMNLKSKRGWEKIKADPVKKEKKNYCQRVYLKNQRVELSDSYVASRVIGKEGVGVLKRSDVPKELIDIKRKQLFLKRQIT